jgi:cell wall-associated NlpC family hydrolase
MRKKHICALVLSACLPALLSVSAYAEQAVVTGNEVNVRNGPGTVYGISASVSRDTTVEILDRSDPDWYQISWDGNSGYVSSQFLSLTEDASSAEVTAEPETSSGSINGMHVYLRAAPSTSAAVLGTYSTGKELTITGTSGDWTAVRIDGTDGYVFSDFVTEAGSNTASLVVDPPLSGSNTMVLPDGGSAPSSGGSTVFVLQEPVTTAPVETLPPDQIIYVPTDGIMHMEAPITPLPTPENTPVPTEAPAESDISGTLITVTERRVVTETAPTPKPSVLPEVSFSPLEPEPVLAEAGEGAAVTKEMPLADISMESYEAASTEGAAASDSAAHLKLGQVTGNAVRLRTGPDSSYSIIGTYDKGTEVAISGVSGEWTAVTLPIEHVSGFIHSDFIEEKAAGSYTDSDASLGSNVATGNYVPSSAQIRDGYITGTGVRLRESPSMSAKILDELNYGTALRITGVSEDWVRVIANGRDGYVAASFVAEGTYAPEAGLSSATGTELGKEIAAYALQYVGTPYKWGGKSPETGFDCSGFVQYIYGQFGFQTSRVANDALSDGVHVDPSDLQPGDLLCFYSGNNYVGHLGIYVGDDLFVHAANSVTGVVTTSLTTGYYAARGYEIRRIT